MKEKVNVTGVPETMVQTLYARAKETKKQNAKIKDEIAVELVEKLDYDFSKADKDSAMTYGVIARTIVLDRMVRQYLENHENTVVVKQEDNSHIIYVKGYLDKEFQFAFSFCICFYPNVFFCYCICSICNVVFSIYCVFCRVFKFCICWCYIFVV